MERRSLAGRAAIVTGGASGIGRACCEALSAAGARVAVADLRTEVAAAVAAGLEESMAVGLDVREPDSVAACTDSVRSAYGRVDVLVNSAALTDAEHHSRDRDPASVDLAVWRSAMATDLEGVMLMCRSVIPVMEQAGGGAIVNISSNAASGGDLVRTAYSAAKAAVNSLTRSIAVAHGRSGIRCNAVSPAGVLGPSYQRNLSPSTRQVLDEMRLLPYPGYPEDVAELVVFLASDAARYITGQVIAVDGGVGSQLPHVPASRKLADAPAGTGP